MEDPNPAEEGAVKEYLVAQEESDGKLSWMVNKGLSVGTKVLVTGFVISSAPMVLPPLLVLSVIGLACSVPSGIFLATYACTDKIMSMLLPAAPPPLVLLDYQTQYSDGEVENNGEYEGLKGLIYMKKEEEELLKDTKGNVEMRIELVDQKEDDEIDAGKSLVGEEHEQASFRIKDVQEIMEDVNEIVEENVIQEDVAGHDEEKEEEGEGIVVKFESIREEEEKPLTDETLGQLPGDEMHAAVLDIAGKKMSSRTIEEEEEEEGAPALAVTNLVIEFCQNGDTEKNEESASETTELLKNIRKEGRTDNGDEKKQSLQKLFGVAEKGDKKAEEIGMSSENKNVYDNVRIKKPRMAIELKIENKLDEPNGSSTGSIDVVPEKTIEPIEDSLGKKDTYLDLDSVEGKMRNIRNLPCY